MKKIKSIEFDPTNAFPGVPTFRLIGLSGIILDMIMDETDDDLPLREKLHNAYTHGGGLFEMKGGLVEEDGTYLYPGDPPLAPAFKLIRDDETFYMYQHAIIAIVQEDGSAFVSRMD